MYIHSAKLTNIRQHRNLEVQFSGFTGLIGQNASGKTNFMLSLRDALNLNSKFSVSKEDLVTWGEKTGSIEVEFSAGPSDERFITTLKVGGRDAGRTVRDMSGRVIAATPDATVEFLTALFGGADQAVVDSLSFAKQAELLQILFQRGSSRGKLAQRIVGASDASRIHSLASEALDRIPPLDVETVRTSLVWMETSAADRAARRPGLQASVDAVADLPSLEEISERITAKTEGIGSGAIKKELQEELSLYKDELQRLQDDIAGIRSRMAGKTSDQIRSMVSKASTQEENILRSKRLKKDSDGLALRIQAECDLSAEEARRAEIDLLVQENVKAAPAAGMLPKMREAGCCPACLRDGLTKEYLDSLEELNIRETTTLRQLDEESATLFEEINRKKNLHHQLRRLKDVMDGDYCHDLAIAGPPRMPSSKMREVLALAIKLETQLSELVGQERSLVSTIENREARIEALPEEGDPDEASLDILLHWRDLQVAADAAQSALDAMDQEETANRGETERLRDSLALEESNAGTRRLLTGLKQIMAYDQAPLAYASARLGEVSEGMNAIIGTLGYNYRVSAGTEFDFSYTKDGGRTWTSAEFLSGGEKAGLVLAFRIEIARIHAAGIRIMALDEPTVWMEEAIKAQFPQVLASMKQLADRDGVQFLVSTHDREVLTCFDSVIEFQ